MSPLVAVLVVLTALLLSTTYHKYSRLSHIPGPFWARFTGFWITWKLWHHESMADIMLDLDRKYGPVVLIAPNNVVFSDPVVIPIIYATARPYKKALSYEPATPLVNGRLQDSFVTTRDEARVSAIKKHINSAFTAAAIGSYESHVDEGIRLFISRVRDAAAQDNKVDFVRWMKLFSFETLCRIAFSDGNFSEQDVQDTLRGAIERFDHWYFWFFLPKLEKLLFKNPFVLGSRGSSLLGRRAVARVQERHAVGGVGMHSDLLESYLKGNRKAPDTFTEGTVVGLVISTIHAGSETTGSTLTDVIRQLLLHPQCLKDLVTELEAAQLTSPPTFASVSKLEYLEAVIKESMRLNLVSHAPLEREVPDGGANIGGVHIPGGTAVALNVQGLSLREDVWGSEPEEFRPHRWLKADQGQRARMERAWSGFGHGKRMCIGQHIAWIEMKKLLPEILLNFDMKLVYPDHPVKYYNTIVGVPTEMWLDIHLRNRELIT
ncbi:hypothetical protein PV08_00014 [Exophiala spinifera]|uniref:Pisatin demethylase n=1 Tax=Exophiala spinifera TaxID=91928 RepID=A0A0D2A3H5_9EURO|nr:uncharacterized protein PV08_00014 [Exophiala spinifera]KIW19442.1 hypothetical protein PV08_00014 [Exophiala spinifera]